MPLPVPIAVAYEFVRAIGGVAIAPLRAALYLANRARWEREVAADLATPVPDLAPIHEPIHAAIHAAIAGAPAPADPARPPLRIFLSCAEHSGEIHGANLIDALRATCQARGWPDPVFHGLGGPALVARGMHSVGNPGERAAMGFDGVLAALPYYLRLLSSTTRHLRAWQPDLIIPVDSPALHVPLARLAKSSHLQHAKIAHFVTPQYWGWAPWRVKTYRRAIDLGLSILPFEAPWYRRHRMPAVHVGHPLLDELAALGAQERNAAPLGGPLILLPGSREGVVRRNLPWMLARIAELQALPGFEHQAVHLAHSRTDLDTVFDELLAASPAKVTRVRGALHDELKLGSAAFVVSGTVVLDLLPHRLPAVVLYRLKGRFQGWLRANLLTVPWFTSLNLLANREVHPEFAFDGEGPQAAVTKALASALHDTAWRAENLAGQELAARRLGPPGAVQRSAAAALDLVEPS